MDDVFVVADIIFFFTVVAFEATMLYNFIVKYVVVFWVELLAVVELLRFSTGKSAQSVMRKVMLVFSFKDMLEIPPLTLSFIIICNIGYSMLLW